MAGLTGQWEQALSEEFTKEYYKKLFLFVKKEFSSTAVYPQAADIFNAFHLTPFEKVKVVISCTMTLGAAYRITVISMSGQNREYCY